MKRHLPLGLVMVAVLQFVALVILPPATLQGLGPVFWVFIVVLFAILGFYLLKARAWSRVATVFIQGFNILVRILVAVGHVLQGGQPGAPVDVWLLSTFTLSIIVSVIILYYVDLPEVQVLMQ
jgi:hypothetical protein